MNPENVPVVFRWIPRASLIKHGFEGLALAEFPGLKFDGDPAGKGGDMTGGEQVRCSCPLSQLNWRYWYHM